MQPENGGRSVFYHEYTHDLGLPDDYNIINGGDNNNEHWTLMAQSRLGAKNDEGIGERGGDLGAWNKLQLGWLNHATVKSTADDKLLLLGPQEYNSNLPQAVVVTLPTQHVTSDMGAPDAGPSQFYSGHTDDNEVTMSRQVSGAGGALTFRTRYDIETGLRRCLRRGRRHPGGGNRRRGTDEPAQQQNGLHVGWDGTSADYVDAVLPDTGGHPRLRSTTSPTPR